MLYLRLNWIVCFVVALGLSGGCEKSKPETAKSTSSPTFEAMPSDAGKEDLQAFLRKDQPAGTAALPSGHPPIGDAHRPPSPAGSDALPPGHPPLVGADAAAAAPAARLHFDPPVEWKPEPVSSSMRVAQFLIPRIDGETQDGQMIVFHFGPGQGGPTDMNIARWKGMFTTPDGEPVGDDAARIEKTKVGDFTVTTLDVAGIYNDPMMLQSGGAPVQGVARMLAAIVETPGGPYFFKAVGPVGTITENVTAFKEMVNSVKQE